MANKISATVKNKMRATVKAALITGASLFLVALFQKIFSKKETSKEIITNSQAQTNNPIQTNNQAQINNLTQSTNVNIKLAIDSLKQNNIKGNTPTRKNIDPVRTIAYDPTKDFSNLKERHVPEGEVQEIMEYNNDSLPILIRYYNEKRTHDLAKELSVLLRKAGAYMDGLEVMSSQEDLKKRGVAYKKDSVRLTISLYPPF